MLPERGGRAETAKFEPVFLVACLSLNVLFTPAKSPLNKPVLLVPLLFCNQHYKDSLKAGFYLYRSLAIRYRHNAVNLG